MVELDEEFCAIKRAVAHIDLGLKAYRAAVIDQIDASRLLESLRDEVRLLISNAGAAEEKIEAGLRQPVASER